MPPGSPHNNSYSLRQSPFLSYSLLYPEHLYSVAYLVGRVTNWSPFAQDGPAVKPWDSGPSVVEKLGWLITILEDTVYPITNKHGN